MYLENEGGAGAEFEVTKHLGFVCERPRGDKLRNVVSVIVTFLVLHVRNMEAGKG